jgi:hypothetical protein
MKVVHFVLDRLIRHKAPDFCTPKEEGLQLDWLRSEELKRRR